MYTVKLLSIVILCMDVYTSIDVYKMMDSAV